MKIIEIAAAEAELDQLLDQLSLEPELEIILLRDGKEVARLLPIGPDETTAGDLNYRSPT